MTAYGAVVNCSDMYGCLPVIHMRLIVAHVWYQPFSFIYLNRLTRKQAAGWQLTDRQTPADL